MADVATCALRARVDAISVTPAGAASVFLPAAVAVWSQLTIGWQWSEPGSTATRAGMLLMTGALLVLGAWVALAIVPAAVAVTRALRAPGARRRGGAPAAVAVLGATALVVGSLHFGHGWPGTGGHPWSGRGLVPAPIARFCWAATLWISAYWAHPSALARFPAASIAWMVASPCVLLAAVGGARRTGRALAAAGTASPRHQARGATLAVGAMAVFVCGAAAWMLGSAAGPADLFAVGAIDFAAVAVMSLATGAAARTVAR